MINSVRISNKSLLLNFMEFSHNQVSEASDKVIKVSEASDKVADQVEITYGLG